jgi:enoyl-CoA hydratase/carnithine racemase
MLTGDFVTGADAERLGIVQWSVPSAEVDALALRIAAGAGDPAASAAIKTCIQLAGRDGDDGFEHEIQASRELYATDQVQQRLAAF